MEDNLGDQRLSLLQDARTFALGKLLRTSFSVADETLDHDVTGLMIDLSKLPASDESPAPRPQPAAQPLPKRTSWLTRFASLFAHP